MIEGGTVNVRVYNSQGSAIALGSCIRSRISKLWAAAPMAGADGAKVYEQRCAQCHNGQVARAPKFEFLKVRSPESIVDALENGVMKFIGLAMSDPDRKAVSEFIAGKPITGEDVLKDTDL